MKKIYIAPQTKDWEMDDALLQTISKGGNAKDAGVTEGDSRFFDTIWDDDEED